MRKRQTVHCSDVACSRNRVGCRATTKTTEEKSTSKTLPKLNGKAHISLHAHLARMNVKRQPVATCVIIYTNFIVRISEKYQRKNVCI